MSERGSATTEHAALTALVGLALIASVAALAAEGPPDRARGIAEALGRRLACAPRHPEPCGRHPLALAYGFAAGKAVRGLAPAPAAVAGPGGDPLLPVDHRRCRRASCAAPGPSVGLTASNRRVTLFTQVRDERRAGGGIHVTYWAYRPGLGWSATSRRAGAADLALHSGLRLKRGDHPVLVPLETLAGRNHHRFPAAEEPPWRWSANQS